MKLFLLLAFISTSFAGGWTQKKSSGFFKLETRYLKATQSYNAFGEKTSIPTVKSFYTSLYGEYGLSETFTIIGKIPFSALVVNNQETEFVTPFSSGVKNSGIGDMAIGFRYGLDQTGSFVSSFSSELELATGDETDPSGIITGDGETNLKINFEIGASFGKNGYVVSSLGYNFRGEGFLNELMFNAEYGIKPTESLLFAVKSRTVLASGDLKSGGLSQAFRQSEYTTLAAELNYFVKKSLGVSFSYETAFNVKSNFSAPVYSMGVFLTI